MKQGTISVLVGCHSPVHSLLVLLAWRKVYGRWPRLWQAGCIFLHDVGHWGMDYLDDPAEKARHWKKGAMIAKRLFGWDGYCLVAGHSSSSGWPGGWIESDLYKPDKYSWLIAPYWWLSWNNLCEPKLKMGATNREAIRWFREQVRQSIESGEYRSTHEMYLERCRDSAEEGR